MFKADTDDSWITWMAAVRHPPEQPDDDIPTICEMADRFQARAVGASLAKSRRVFQQWATKMRKQAPGVLHRHVKQQGDAAQIPKDEYFYKATVFVDPTVIMDRRADEWEAIWGDPKVTVDMLLQGVEM
eukprot:7970201-Pyramimonas_sp.AAC.1